MVHPQGKHIPDAFKRHREFILLIAKDNGKKKRYPLRGQIIHSVGMFGVGFFPAEQLIRRADRK